MGRETKGFCGGVAAPARLERMPVADARAAAAVAEIDAGGLGLDSGGLSANSEASSAAVGSVGSGEVLLIPRRASTYFCTPSPSSSFTGEVNFLCCFFGFFFGESFPCSLCLLFSPFQYVVVPFTDLTPTSALPVAS